MKKLLSILLASTMLILSASMISVSTVDAATTESTESTTVTAESTELSTEATEPTTESTAPVTEATQPETTEKKEKTYKNFTYSVNGKTVTITKYTGSAKSVKIPSEIDGKKVRVIGKKAFMIGKETWDDIENTTLKKVTIPNSVYEIEDFAFHNCVNLNKVSIGKNVQKLGSGVFWGCKSLKTFKIPSKVTKLNSSVFAHTGITTFHIGKNIRNITSSSFFNTHNPQMKKITVAKNNKTFSSKDGVLYNKKQTKLLICPRALDKTTLTLPTTVKKIERSAFEYNKKLRAVNLSNVEDIGVLAFNRCKNLREITIPESTKLIQEFAFSGCAKLEKITFLNKDVELYDCAFSSCGIKEVDVPYRSEEAFRSCKKLKKITISPDMEILGPKEFFNLPKLKSVTIPKTVKHIGKKAFGFQYKTVDGNLKVVKVKGFTIKGKKNTAAHRYAKKHGFKFVEIK